MERNLKVHWWIMYLSKPYKCALQRIQTEIGAQFEKVRGLFTYAHLISVHYSAIRLRQQRSLRGYVEYVLTLILRVCITAQFD